MRWSKLFIKEHGDTEKGDVRHKLVEVTERQSDVEKEIRQSEEALQNVRTDRDHRSGTARGTLFPEHDHDPPERPGQAGKRPEPGDQAAPDGYREPPAAGGRGRSRSRSSTSSRGTR